MQSFYPVQKLYLAQQPSDSSPISPVVRANQIDYLLGSFIIITPLALMLTLFVYRKRQAAVLKRQLILLEKIWKVDTHERSS